MTRTLPWVTLYDMATHDRINSLVLQEFRLHAADTAGDAARIVAAFSSGLEPAVPLLTSIDDDRDVATLRALRPGESLEGDPGQRAALDPLVASWQPLKHYGPQITEQSDKPPAYYRLAVTESGINDAESERPAATPRGPSAERTAASLDLLWIGRPVGTYAGLLALVGSEEGKTARPDPRSWPLPISRYLGVRIYESQQ